MDEELSCNVVLAKVTSNEDDFEIDTGLRDGMEGVKQEDPVQKDEGKLAARERPGTLGEKQVDGCFCHERTVVATTKEATIFNCGHVVIDSANETTCMYW